MTTLTAKDLLPEDGTRGTLAGRVWQPQANGSLLNPQSGRCLDSPSGATADGTKLQIYDCNGLDPQRWKTPV